MGEGELSAAIAQFGMAWLIGWMWLVERRAAAVREKQLCDLHDRIMDERRQADALLSVVSANTRALTALEVGQRGLVTMLERVVHRAAHDGRAEQS